MNFRAALCLSASLSVLHSMTGLATSLPYARLIVIGDSLSDSGNAGRFSNGPVWVEYLSKETRSSLQPARLGGTNFAVGGARTHGHAFSLREQADLLLGMWDRHAPDRQTLFIVYGGSNDLRAAVHVADRQAVVDRAVRELNGILTDLVQAGAAELLVPNLPNIGRTPEARQHGAAWVAQSRELVISFNEQLEHILADIERKPSVRVHRFDVFGLLERAAESPASFGFDNVTTPCIGSAAAPDCAGYVFWDSLHPTTSGHARFGEAVRESLAGAAIQRRP
jgi:phospholipase/lecithinase/hemolysin